MMNYKPYLCVSLALCLSWPCQARQWHNWQWNLFASQALMHSNANNFYGESADNSSLDYSELGLLVSRRFQQDWQVSGQLLSRRAGETDDGKPRFDFAFVSYQFVNNIDRTWGLRLGRLKSTYGFYNDTRDVAFTRPGILLPQAVYFDRIRNTLFAQNALQLFGERRWQLHNLSWQLAATETDADAGELTDASGIALSGRAEGNMTGQGRLMYSHDADRFRLALSYRASDLDFSPDLIPITGTVITASTAYSAEYNAANWSLSAEFVNTDAQAQGFAAGAGFGSPIPDFDTDAQSYYMQWRWRPIQRWDILARYDVLYLNKDDKNGNRFALAVAGTPLARPAYSQFAKDKTLGLGWQPNARSLIRLEWHRVNGTGWLSQRDNPLPAQTQQDWNLGLIQASYRF